MPIDFVVFLRLGESLLVLFVYCVVREACILLVSCGLLVVLGRYVVHVAVLLIGRVKLRSAERYAAASPALRSVALCGCRRATEE